MGKETKRMECHPIFSPSPCSIFVLRNVVHANLFVWLNKSIAAQIIQRAKVTVYNVIFMIRTAARIRNLYV